jgi:hypothetical protein
VAISLGCLNDFLSKITPETEQTRAYRREEGVSLFIIGMGIVMIVVILIGGWWK